MASGQINVYAGVGTALTLTIKVHKTVKNCFNIAFQANYAFFFYHEAWLIVFDLNMTKRFIDERWTNTK